MEKEGCTSGFIPTTNSSNNRTLAQNEEGGDGTISVKVINKEVPRRGSAMKGKKINSEIHNQIRNSSMQRQRSSQKK